MYYDDYYNEETETITYPRRVKNRSKNYTTSNKVNTYKDYHPPKLTEENILDRIKDLKTRLNSSPASITEVTKLLDYVYDLIIKLRKNYNEINIAVGDEIVVINDQLADDVLEQAVTTYVIEALMNAVIADQEITKK